MICRQRNVCQKVRNIVLWLTFSFLLISAVVILRMPKVEIPAVCDRSFCHHHAICFTTLNSFVCKCDGGFYGNGKSCRDIDECKQGFVDCGINAVCHNNIGSFYCDCAPGFHRTNGGECLDTNECTANANACHINAICENAIGSYNCTCMHDYVGNGRYCEYNPTNCEIPKNIMYPDCENKVKWLEKFWKTHPCYKRLGVTGTVCSFIKYLSEVEHECPPLPGGSKENTNEVPNRAKELVEAELDRTDKSVLMNIILYHNFRWIRKRISSMWNDWITSYQTFKKHENIEHRKKKMILIFAGILADKDWSWAYKAEHGGPLGELVQWADLIAATYLLGHSLFIASSTNDLLPRKSKKTSPCGDKYVSLTHYDLIYIDIHGLHLLQKQKVDMQKFRCKLRVLDSFGTEARFNFLTPSEDNNVSLNGSAVLAKKLLKNPYGYGNWKLNLKQFMTMFPHSPDNSFLGFIVGRETEEKIDMSKKENISLVYGKKNYMLKGHTAYLSILHQYTLIHGNVNPDIITTKVTKPSEQSKLQNVPSFVINHGLMGWNELQTFLRKTKIFVGLGFPFEGPAPLEAIAQGAVFINPKWDPPLNRLNDQKFNNKLFFEGKPTLRKLSSQHPYMEMFIGKPHVHTIQIKNKSEVQNTINKILGNFRTNKIKPFLPYEFTHEGMLQRLNIYIEKQDFCNTNSVWPKINALKFILSNLHESCREACIRKNFVCENSLFKYVNTHSAFQIKKIKCDAFNKKNSLLAPYVDARTSTCILQKEQLLFSCVDSAEYYRRLCPCRRYVKGQVALCPDEM